MKNLVLFFILFYSVKSFSQDSIRLKRIDSIVKQINNSNYSIQQDSTIKDFPQQGLWIKTLMTTLSDSNQLRKYVNDVRSRTTINGIAEETSASNSFYFYQNKLVKVEEFMIKNGKELYADWYYADEKPLYYSLKHERSEERAIFLLNLSKTMVKTIH
ncbi:MAG TPA: hypothetical protein VF144_17060 [Chitinophagaceae bacterium]